jgi:hypothetical protein
VATPIAASLGDLVTLAILAQSAKMIHGLDNSEYGESILSPKVIYPIAIIAIYATLITPFCVNATKSCVSTNELLSTGWTPGT